MSVQCRTGGLTVEIESMSQRWIAFAREAYAGQETAERGADVSIVISESEKPFDLVGYEPLTRGAWGNGQSVIMQDACGSGADLAITPMAGALCVVARVRPTLRHRGLGVLDPARRVLLYRAAMIQYPALWWAGVRGGVPLHVSAALVDRVGVLLAGPGGVGKSTLMSEVRPPRGSPVSDNLCVCSGQTVHGLLEPSRGADGRGRKMPHGRRESAWQSRLESVVPQHIVVLRRGSGTVARVRELGGQETARVLTAGTYAAGELRRYWAFAATLALGTALGPAHPPVARIAEELAAGMRCSEAVLPATPGTTLAALLTLAGDTPVGRPAERASRD